MEKGGSLWLARATPRSWLEQGKRVSVRNAPTHFGTVDYEIVSDVDNGRITAKVRMPSREAPEEVLLRLRHPKALPIRSVRVNGRPWEHFDSAEEFVRLRGLTDDLIIEAMYR